LAIKFSLCIDFKYEYFSPADYLIEEEQEIKRGRRKFKMNIEIRNEREKDYSETENITREAFWDIYKPGCDEHLLLNQLRRSNAFIPELDLVACDDGKIIGNIVYTKAMVKEGDNETEVLCMGPLCVLPEYQKKGVGSLLMRTTIEKARSLGYRAVIIYGNPPYYHRFGFVSAETHGIKTAQGINFDAFMALELYKGALDGVTGNFFEDKAFEIKGEELEEFDKSFPPREKHVREGQLK
jgi:predicted N-acetyltransferase YhbS